MSDHLRICLLTDQELDADPFPADDWPCDPRPYIPEAEWTLLTLEKESCVTEVLKAGYSGSYDVFFNLCSGAWDEGAVGIEVIQTLEMLNVPFTGADSFFYEPSREAMKRACHAWGLHSPAYGFVTGVADVPRLLDTLRFPMFVKHPSSYASAGIERASRVTSRKELEAQVKRITGMYGSALVEEFIEGIECTVLVAENGADPAQPITYRSLEYRFPEGDSFKHHDLKWVNYDGLGSALVEDDELDASLRQASADFFAALHGAGYGRTDIRVDAEGRPFILEINPNCGLFLPETDPGSADLILFSIENGHSSFARTVVDAAFARWRSRQRAWRTEAKPGGGYGVYATRAVKAGDSVVPMSERAHRLVSRNGLAPSGTGRPSDWLARYVWPLSDEVAIEWGKDPEEWSPVDHSCDPSAWLSGLDVVARRDIAAGEEVTIDFATVHDATMPAFECGCGAPACRGRVNGEDHLTGIVDRYEGHLSEHIRRRRAARS